MINAFKALFASIELLFIGLGRYAKAFAAIGTMTEEAAEAMADKARIERARQLVELEKADRKIAHSTKP